jgi:hypothetical protein
VSAAIGPFDDFAIMDGGTGRDDGSKGTHFGGALGGGADILFGRHFTLGVDSRLQLVSGRSSHFGVTVSFGWMFGGRL